MTAAPKPPSKPAAKTASRARARPTKPAAAKPAPAKAVPAVVSAATPALEWIAAGVGLALFLAALAFIGLEIVRGPPSPPVVAAEVLEIRRTPAGYLARIRARNNGGSPAAAVVVEGELTTPGAAAQAAEATFDFLPARSQRDGGLYFSTDPRGGTLTLRAKGYTDP